MSLSLIIFFSSSCFPITVSLEKVILDSLQLDSCGFCKNLGQDGIVKEYTA